MCERPAQVCFPVYWIPSLVYVPVIFNPRPDLPNMSAPLQEIDPNRAIVQQAQYAADCDNESLDYDSDEPFTFNCGEVRVKINALIRSGEMLQTHFLEKLNINSNSYGRYMKLKGP